jgi:hypothetical protein
MRFYSLLDGDETVCTINADSAQEAQNVLSALLGGGALSLRRATPGEIQAWTESATQPRSKLRRLKKKAARKQLADAAD